ALARAAQDTDAWVGQVAEAFVGADPGDADYESSASREGLWRRTQEMDQLVTVDDSVLGPRCASVATSGLNSWQQAAQSDTQSPGYEQDLQRLRQIEADARRGALNHEEAAELYNIMLRHTWWFTNVPPTVGGADSPLTVEEARVAFWGLWSAKSDVGSYYQESLYLINAWMKANRPPTTDPTSPDYQTWVQSQANLAGLMNCSPNFDTEQQLSALNDYESSVLDTTDKGIDVIGIVDTVDSLHGISSGIHDSNWRPRGDDGRFQPFGPLQGNVPGVGIVDMDPVGAGGISLTAGAAGVGPEDAVKAIDHFTVARAEENWRTQAHDYEQFGMSNVVQEVNRATLQNLSDGGQVQLPAGWQSWDMLAQRDWAANQAPPAVGQLILDLDQRVAANTGLHH
ncbi:MAG TPA: hypothetical protein VFH58_04320, partial [Acidimicrobiales bacterium]|nr:hypothetical protein [Acidimicrobiales bacterium]